MPKIPWLTSQGYRAHAPLKLSTADLPRFGKRPAGSGTLAKTAPGAEAMPHCCHSHTGIYHIGRMPLGDSQG
jgi:hypothetical protein